MQPQKTSIDTMDTVLVNTNEVSSGGSSRKIINLGEHESILSGNVVV